jgi:hypothetical protein
MEKSSLPISYCHATCPKCKMPTEFPMFESGFGGDFSTYLGEATGSIYRVNMDLVHYGDKDLDEVLSWGIEHEGGKHNLRAVPGEIKCKICSNIYNAESVGLDKEGFAEVYELI